MSDRVCRSFTASDGVEVSVTASLYGLRERGELLRDQLAHRALGAGAPFPPRQEVVPAADLSEVDVGADELFSRTGARERGGEPRVLRGRDDTAARPLRRTVAGPDAVRARRGHEVL